MVKNTEINLSTLSRDLKKSPSDAVVIGAHHEAKRAVVRADEREPGLRAFPRDFPAGSEAVFP